MSSPATSLRNSQVELRIRMEEARRLTDAIFLRVAPGGLYERPIPERHRLIFYLGHLEAFDWNLLSRTAAAGATASQPVPPEWHKLFAFGIDPVDGQLPSDQPSDWPTEYEVRRYAAGVREQLDAFLDGATGTFLNVAIEHRLMHAETLAYLLHQLPYGKKLPNGSSASIGVPAPTPRVVPVSAGVATLGLRRGGATFGWDNEFEVKAVSVPEFQADVFPVTNAQYLGFVQAGGYDNQSFWSPDDWHWRTAVGIRHPGFWEQRDDGWYLRAMFEELPLPAAWPVYVSHAEASAYARWRGKQLPSEAQWQRMAYGQPLEDPQDNSFDGLRAYPWGSAPPSREHGNFDSRLWDPAPVHAHPQGQSAFGIADLIGNGWEWTSTQFAPFPGFEPFPFYPGYSADFFDGKHYVMKGGSPRTAACMLRRSFRNWFQPHYPYVYAKFRCVE